MKCISIALQRDHQQCVAAPLRRGRGQSSLESFRRRQLEVRRLIHVTRAMIKLRHAAFLALTASGCLTTYGRADEITKEKFERIVAGEDDRSSMLDELRIYPNAKRYRIVVTTTARGEAPKKQKPAIATEKWVDGKYIVSRFRPPPLDDDIVMVVSFDREANVYRKWIRVGETDVVQVTGFRVGMGRTVSWFQELTRAGVPAAYSLEEHSDRESRWTELYVKDGKIDLRIEGVATKIE